MDGSFKKKHQITAWPKSVVRQFKVQSIENSRKPEGLEQQSYSTIRPNQESGNHKFIFDDFL